MKCFKKGCSPSVKQGALSLGSFSLGFSEKAVGQTEALSTLDVVQEAACLTKLT